MSNNRRLIVFAVSLALLLLPLISIFQLATVAENVETDRMEFFNTRPPGASLVEILNGNVNWTVLVYLDGDNNLEGHAFDDLNAMETIGSTLNVKIIVFVDFYDGSVAPFTGAKCFEITQDSNRYSITSSELTTTLPSEPNMGSPTTLRDFIVFGQSYAPADHYLLVLWDHGSGAYGLCQDDTSGDRLSIAELNQALSSPLIQYLDIVAFDACLMGQLEVAYEIRAVTDLVVFSEESIPFTGFPYEDILLNLTTVPGSNPKTVATSLVYYYVTAYDIGGRYDDLMETAICLSAVETAKLDAVVETLNHLTELLYANINNPQIYEAVSWAREGTQDFTWVDFIDLGCFANELAARINAYPYLQSAMNLSAYLQAAVYEEMHLNGVPDATGLGAVFGLYGSNQLALADDSAWDEFIEAYLDIGSSFAIACPLVEYQGPGAILGLHHGYLDGAYDSVYYIFTATETGLHTFAIDAAWILYETDFDLYIYDSFQDTLSESISSDSSESITIHLTAGSIYYIEVYSYPTGGQSAGVFLLQVNTPSSPGPTIPIPPLTIMMLIAGLVFGILVGVVIIVIYRRRQTSMAPAPPRYTTPTQIPPSATEAGEKTKFCTYCGAVLPYRAQYCPICGASTS